MSRGGSKPGPRGPYRPVAEQVAEMAALEAISRDRALTRAESERWELLQAMDQRRARYRPARIARLRAELAMLEAQEREAAQRELAKQPRLPLVYLVREAA